MKEFTIFIDEEDNVLDIDKLEEFLACVKGFHAIRRLNLWYALEIVLEEESSITQLRELMSINGFKTYPLLISSGCSELSIDR